jgi:hypothetical protein
VAWPEVARQYIYMCCLLAVMVTIFECCFTHISLLLKQIYGGRLFKFRSFTHCIV